MDNDPYEYLALRQMLTEARELVKQLERECADLRAENTKLRRLLAEAGFKSL